MTLGAGGLSRPVYPSLPSIALLLILLKVVSYPSKS